MNVHQLLSTVLESAGVLTQHAQDPTVVIRRKKRLQLGNSEKNAVKHLTMSFFEKGRKVQKTSSLRLLGMSWGVKLPPVWRPQGCH